MESRRIGVHVTGASGSGSTTLSQSLAQRLGARDFDTDDYFWEPSDPPYQKQRDAHERLRLLSDDLERADRWVLSGAVMGWGDSLIRRFDLVIFLYAPTQTRLLRLAARERGRFGAAIESGGPLHAEHQAFMEWAAAYDTGVEMGRSLERHRVWLAALPCPVLRLDSVSAPELLVEGALQAIADLRAV